jgi:murein L,D-transpeptidase YafK
MDRRLEKQGNGIWVHGTNEELKPRSTNGCVALVNEDIDQLASYIRLWDTPIIIEKKLRYEDAGKLRRQGLDILERIEGWSQAWSQKDLDRYMSYYASDFRWKALNRKRWRQRKAGLNKRYKEISVQLSDIRLFRHGDTVTATAEMIYRSDRFASHGFKRLHLVQNSREWRILGEEWRRSGRPVPPPLRLAAKPAKPTRVASKQPKPTESPEQSLHRFVQNWRRAWEKGDLSAYMAYYHPQFKTRNMDRRAWKQYKKELFEHSSERVVKLRDVKVKANGSTARVAFKQEYRTKRHQDFGQKTLRLRRHRGQWTILTETWKQLPDQG